MISIEEVRQELYGLFKTAQDIAYPGMLVNYPNYVVVDLEHQEDPFVSLELNLEEMPLAALGEREILVKGSLVLYYYFRHGTGVMNAYQYADFINTELGMKLLGVVQFGPASFVNVQTFPGWAGRMISLPYDIVTSVSCA